MGPQQTACRARREEMQLKCINANRMPSHLHQRIFRLLETIVKFVDARLQVVPPNVKRRIRQPEQRPMGWIGLSKGLLKMITLRQQCDRAGAAQLMVVF
uniref:Uncharacterized protein n=1 Tax=Pristionchus pacificus TaxID=54126 RepID=A0A2A6C6C0_PRIPA|eukprot:PDM73571.1 hypothetical protein PRIPAC_40927 [Pristionchus pacificus]